MFLFQAKTPQLEEHHHNKHTNTQTHKPIAAAAAALVLASLFKRQVTNVLANLLPHPKIIVAKQHTLNSAASNWPHCLA